MTQAPGGVSREQLEELYLELNIPEESSEESSEESAE